MKTYIRPMRPVWMGAFACLMACSCITTAAKAPQDNWYYDGVFTTNFTSRVMGVMTNGNIVAQGSGNAVAQIYDPAGNFLANWGENLVFPSTGQWQNVEFAGIGPSNVFYVHQEVTPPPDEISWLHVFDQDENHIIALWELDKAVTTTTVNQLSVAADADGNVYSGVSLSSPPPVQPGYVVVHSPSGVQLSTWQPFTPPPGGSTKVTDIAVGKDGRVYVSGGTVNDVNADPRIYIASFAQDGTPIAVSEVITNSFLSSERSLLADDIVLAVIGQTWVAYTLDLEFIGNIGTPDNPLALSPSFQTGSSSNGDIIRALDGSLLVSFDQGGFEGIFRYRNGIRTMLPPGGDVLPSPQVISIAQRPNAGIIDIDYKVADPNDATTHTAVIALPNGSDAVADIVLLNTFVDGTQANQGAGTATGQELRISWDADADLTNDFINMVFRVLAKDDQGLLDLHYITVPAEGANPSFLINRTPLVESDFQQAWLWLLASGDANVTRLGNGTLQAVGGAFDGLTLVDGAGATTSDGRAFLFDRLNVRVATGSEETQAREAGTPGVVNQFDPRNRVGERPKQVNAYGLDTGDWGAERWYVVPLP